MPKQVGVVGRVERILEQRIELLQKELAVARGRRLWKCSFCKAKKAIGKLTIIVEEYYVRPSGCTDGDYWTEGTNPSFCIECPKCGKENRRYTFDSNPHTLYTAGTEEGNARINEQNRRYLFVKQYRRHFGKSETRRRENG